MPSPKAELTLTDDERQTLETWASRFKSTQRLATRAKIVLACADGLDNTTVAARLGVCSVTVGTWRRRFTERRPEALADEPRPGAPRKLTDADVERVVTQTLEPKLEAATHWDTRGLAGELGLSQSTVGRIWRASGLKPHKARTFTLSTDPFFVEKVRDVVGLHVSPPERAIVLRVDEKSQVQASDRTQPLLPRKPGPAERHTHDDVRNGTTSPFAALNVATGEVIGTCHRRHRHREFLRFPEEVDAKLTWEPGVEVHLVLDNDATHRTPAAKRWLLRHPEHHLHFTPTSSSWLDQLERFFGAITEKRLRRGVFRSVRALEAAIREYLDHHNANPRPFKGTADADLILNRIKKVIERSSDSGHQARDWPLAEAVGPGQDVEGGHQAGPNAIAPSGLPAPRGFSAASCWSPLASRYRTELGRAWFGVAADNSPWWR